MLVRLSGLPVRPCSLSPDGLSGCSMSLRWACLTFSRDDVAVDLGEELTGETPSPCIRPGGPALTGGAFPRDHLRGPTTALATPRFHTHLSKVPRCGPAALQGGEPLHTCETDLGPHGLTTPLAPDSGPVGCRTDAGRPPSSLVHPRTAAQVPLATQRTGWTGRERAERWPLAKSLREAARLSDREGHGGRPLGWRPLPACRGPRGSSFPSGSAGVQGTDLG